MPELHLCCFSAAAGPLVRQLHLRGAVQGTDLQAQETWSLLEADYFRLLSSKAQHAHLKLWNRSSWAWLGSTASSLK